MNISHPLYNKLHTTWNMLRFSYGLFFLIVGIDKFLNLIVAWEQYINPWIIEITNLSPELINLSSGVLEIVCGILLLFNTMTRLTSYLIALACIIIAINLAAMGMFLDIAARDIILAIGAIVLARLTTIKNGIKDTHAH